jgi:hypothetical protein
MSFSSLSKSGIQGEQWGVGRLVMSSGMIDSRQALSLIPSCR